MAKKKKAEPSSYRVWLSPAVHRIRRKLPGRVRQRIRRQIDRLAHDPRPPKSRQLQFPESVPDVARESWEVRRVRIEDWRVIYGIHEGRKEVAVLKVAQRPPYRYEDLEQLLEQLLSGLG